LINSLRFNEHMNRVSIEPDVSESEFYSALRDRRPNFYIADEAEREAAYREWLEWSTNNKPPGQMQSLHIRQAFQHAHDLINTQGWLLDVALRHALEVFKVTYPSGYKSDEKAWFRRVRQSYNSIPQHRHPLLKDDVVYGVTHAKEALIRKLPHVVAVIFITSDRSKRRRIIKAVY
jgi:hypothetical protein